VTLVIVLVILAIIFNYLNGFHDAANIVATIISSRAMSPRAALWVTAAAEFCGPFLFGVAVAKTIGEDLVDPVHVSMPVIVAALGSAILWNLLTWWLSIPSSSSHALIGGLIGAIAAGGNWQLLHVSGLLKIFVALFIAPFLGLLAGYLLTKLILYLARNAHPRVNIFFRSAQIFTGIGLALSHGANDAQKTMGIITMGLVVNGTLTSFEIPTWVIVVCAGAIALGTATGGMRLIRTLGAKFYKIQPIHGFATQLSSASVILGAALLGGPVSTTQVVSSAIAGVGSAERANKVRWGVLGNMALTWLITIPATAGVSALMYIILTALAQ
jgi:PiT family inorganic phosphate transporter